MNGKVKIELLKNILILQKLQKMWILKKYFYFNYSNFQLKFKPY